MLILHQLYDIPVWMILLGGPWTVSILAGDQTFLAEVDHDTTAGDIMQDYKLKSLSCDETQMLVDYV